MGLSPMGLVLVLVPLLVVIGVTALIWREMRWVRNTTTRHFARLLFLALLWTPIPDVATQNFGAFSFSGIRLLSLTFYALQTRFQAQLSPGIAEQQLAAAIAVGVVCVLGGIVIVARSWVQLRRLRTTATAGKTQSPAR